jgi:hypothetical protein
MQDASCLKVVCVCFVRACFRAAHSEKCGWRGGIVDRHGRLAGGSPRCVIDVAVSRKTVKTTAAVEPVTGVRAYVCIYVCMYVCMYR